MSLPCHQPEKWNGMKAWSGPTPSVNFAVTLIRAPVGVLTHTCSPLRILRSAAVFGLISTKFSCISSASHGLERVSSPPPSYSTSRPLVRMIGKSLPMFLYFSCTDLNRSEEHTSELQSQSNLVCRLLLEKKKKATHHPDRSGARCT